MMTTTDVPTAPGIRLTNVSVRLGGTSILEGVNAEIPANEITAIIGPNGAGKTTLLRVLLDQIDYTGDVKFNGGGRPRIGYVPQRLDMDRAAPIRVADFLAADTQRRPLWVGLRDKARATGHDMLRHVGAEYLYERRLGALSGGELQRVLLAMALSMKPDVLLLDEPVAGVDVAGQGLFCDLLTAVQRQLHCTMVLVLHELTVVTQHADYVVCLNNRRVMCEGRTLEAVTTENLRAVFGSHLSLYHHHGRHDGHDACGPADHGGCNAEHSHTHGDGCSHH